jgi:hypothetical protein
MLGIEDKRLAMACLLFMAGLVPLTSFGAQTWVILPRTGVGGGELIFWWIVVSTIVMEVGVGVSCQPLLAVRFMAVNSTRRSDRAVGGGRTQPSNLTSFRPPVLSAPAWPDAKT